MASLRVAKGRGDQPERSSRYAKFRMTGSSSPSVRLRPTLSCDDSSAPLMGLAVSPLACFHARPSGFGTPLSVVQPTQAAATSSSQVPMTR
jgi:hypothetical protein